MDPLESEMSEDVKSTEDTSVADFNSTEKQPLPTGDTDEADSLTDEEIVDTSKFAIQQEIPEIKEEKEDSDSETNPPIRKRKAEEEADSDLEEAAVSISRQSKKKKTATREEEFKTGIEEAVSLPKRGRKKKSDPKKELLKSADVKFLKIKLVDIRHEFGDEILARGTVVISQFSTARTRSVRSLARGRYQSPAVAQPTRGILKKTKPAAVPEEKSDDINSSPTRRSQRQLSNPRPSFLRNASPKQTKVKEEVLSDEEQENLGIEVKQEPMSPEETRRSPGRRAATSREVPSSPLPVIKQEPLESPPAKRKKKKTNEFESNKENIGTEEAGRSRRSRNVTFNYRDMIFSDDEEMAEDEDYDPDDPDDPSFGDENVNDINEDGSGDDDDDNEEEEGEGNDPDFAADAENINKTAKKSKSGIKKKIMQPQYLEEVDALLKNLPRHSITPYICPKCHEGYLSTTKGRLHRLVVHDPRSQFTLKLVRCDDLVVKRQTTESPASVIDSRAPPKRIMKAKPKSVKEREAREAGVSLDLSGENSEILETKDEFEELTNANVELSSTVEVLAEDIEIEETVKLESFRPSKEEEHTGTCTGILETPKDEEINVEKCTYNLETKEEKQVSESQHLEENLHLSFDDTDGNVAETSDTENQDNTLHNSLSQDEKKATLEAEKSDNLDEKIESESQMEPNVDNGKMDDDSQMEPDLSSENIETETQVEADLNNDENIGSELEIQSDLNADEEDTQEQSQEEDEQDDSVLKQNGDMEVAENVELNMEVAENVELNTEGDVASKSDNISSDKFEIKDCVTVYSNGGGDEEETFTTL